MSVRPTLRTASVMISEVPLISGRKASRSSEQREVEEYSARLSSSLMGTIWRRPRLAGGSGLDLGVTQETSGVAEIWQVCGDHIWLIHK